MFAVQDLQPIPVKNQRVTWSCMSHLSLKTILTLLPSNFLG